MSDSAEAREALARRFPDLQPLKSAPAMQTVNGIGARLYGRRDYDPETRSYVKTHSFCVAFIPLIALGAYRVVDAGATSWYFLGKVHLSPFAKAWNFAVLGLIVLLGGSLVGSLAWDSYTQSPAYQQARALAHAQEAAQEGRYVPAADEFAVVANAHGATAPDANAGLQDILDHHLLEQKGPAAIHLLATANTVSHDLATPTGGALFQTGLNYISANLQNRPRDSQAMRDYLFKNCANHAPVDALEIPLLQALIAAEPQNPQVISDLAQVYERNQNTAALEALLIAHKNQLGDTEAARILGQLYYVRGDMESAYPLLAAYSTGRLKHMLDCQLDYNISIERAWKQALNGLKNGDAPQTWYRKYDALAKDPDAQDKLVAEWLNAKLDKDASLKKKIDAYKASTAIVPIALDLGIARLSHANGLADPVKRKTELEEIEKLFLNMESVAGESDDYHLFYGQVCYWLGKREEGHKQFDDLLAHNQRKPEALFAVSQKLREVGENADALKLAEEAYSHAKDDDFRKALANYLSIIAETTEEKEAWLAKAQVGENSFSAAWLKVEKAVGAHDRTKIADACHAAIDLATKTAKSGGSLNLAAIANHCLFEATGGTQALKDSIDLGAEATQMMPKDSILLGNYLRSLKSQLCVNLWGDRLQYHRIFASADFDDAQWFYLDQAGYDTLVQKAKHDPLLPTLYANGIRQITLAPSDVDGWDFLASLYSLTDDDDATKALLERRRALPPPSAAERQAARAFYSGEQDSVAAKQALIEAAFFHQLLIGPVHDLPPPTRTRLLSAWIVQTLTAEANGEPIDDNLLLQRAEECWKLQPSYTARWMRISAHLIRCLRTIGKKLPAAADYRKQSRYLAPAEQIAWCAEAVPAAKTQILEDADFKAAVDLMRANRLAFPQNGSVQDWLVFRLADPDLAARVAKNLTTNPHLADKNELNLRLHPLRVSAAADDCVLQLIAGHPDEAKKRWQAYVDDGLPLPPLPDIK